VLRAGKEERPAWFDRSLTAACKRFGKPPALWPAFRWSLLALALVAAAAAVIAAVVWAGEIGGALSTEFPAWWSLLAAGAALLLLIAYLGEKGPLPIRAVGHVLVSFGVPILAAPFLWLSALVTLAFNPLFLWLGRVREPVTELAQEPLEAERPDLGRHEAFTGENADRLARSRRHRDAHATVPGGDEEAVVARNRPDDG
jgi:hypothetical protein